MGDFGGNIFYFPKGRKWPSCYDCYDRARVLGERIIHMQSSLTEMQTVNVLIFILKCELLLISIACVARNNDVTFTQLHS